MKIRDNRYSGIEAFGTLSVGDIFEWAGGFYIKIPLMTMSEWGSDKVTEYNAIFLETGIPETFLNGCEVKIVKATLIIGEVD